MKIHIKKKLISLGLALVVDEHVGKGKMIVQYGHFIVRLLEYWSK